MGDLEDQLTAQGLLQEKLFVQIYPGEQEEQIWGMGRMEVLSAVIGYLLGSVNTAILLSRFFYHDDVRSEGSGNAGATNAGRSYGMLAGVLTLAGDLAKAIVSCAVGHALAGDTGVALAGLFCLLGHCWPVFFHFHGGKGVAVSAGTLLYLDWRLFLIAVGLFAVVILLTRFVSLGSLAAVGTYPFFYYAFHGPDIILAMTTLMCVLVVFQHRSNIGRLLKGTERKISFHHQENK